MAKTVRDEDLRLNIIINGDNGRKEIGELERKIHDTNAKLEQLYDKRKKLEQQGKQDTVAYKNLQSQIGRYNKTLENNRERLASLQRQQSVNTMTLQELRKHINRVQIELNKTDRSRSVGRNLTQNSNSRRLVWLSCPHSRRPPMEWCAILQSD